MNTAGTLAPGTSTGNTIILGEYMQQTGGTLQIEVGGTGMGTTFDFVNVNGDAIIDGELELALVDGYLPPSDTDFIVFNADNLLGIFENVANNERLATTDGSGSFLVNYGVGSAFDPTQIVLSDFEQTFLPGDFNNNGIVDAADYPVWLAALGAADESLISNNGDGGGVTLSDYELWKSSLGNTSGTGSKTTNAPEPRSVWMVIISFVVRGIAIPRLRNPEP